MTIEVRKHSGEGIRALPCSPQELSAHVLPTLGLRACQFLMRQVEAAPHGMLTLCFMPKPKQADQALSCIDWEFQGVLSMPQGELDALARSMPSIKRLYAARKDWTKLINERLSDLH